MPSATHAEGKSAYTIDASEHLCIVTSNGCWHHFLRLKRVQVKTCTLVALEAGVHDLDVVMRSWCQLAVEEHSPRRFDL